MKSVCNSAQLCCTYGVMPGFLNIIYRGTAFIPFSSIATIFDCVPYLNVQPFVVCLSPTNPFPPIAGGKPCIPSFEGVWTSLSPQLLLLGVPVLQSDAVLLCQYAGIVGVVRPGQLLSNSQFQAPGPAASFSGSNSQSESESDSGGGGASS